MYVKTVGKARRLVFFLRISFTFWGLSKGIYVHQLWFEDRLLTKRIDSGNLWPVREVENGVHIIVLYIVTTEAIWKDIFMKVKGKIQINIFCYVWPLKNSWKWITLQVWNRHGAGPLLEKMLDHWVKYGQVMANNETIFTELWLQENSWNGSDLHIYLMHCMGLVGGYL